MLYTKHMIQLENKKHLPAKQYRVCVKENGTMTLIKIF